MLAWSYSYFPKPVLIPQERPNFPQVRRSQQGFSKKNSVSQFMCFPRILAPSPEERSWIWASDLANSLRCYHVDMEGCVTLRGEDTSESCCRVLPRQSSRRRNHSGRPLGLKQKAAEGKMEGKPALVANPQSFGCVFIKIILSLLNRRKEMAELALATNDAKESKKGCVLWGRVNTCKNNSPISNMLQRQGHAYCLRVRINRENRRDWY